ncbi:B3 domain-containing protein [Forsythia ovata]|uniref:B3 domain-containing protein n=1 Tax=Forsythia ovata TaxID=205694 RepID=A0ABD1X140_9LAMI
MDSSAKSSSSNHKNFISQPSQNMTTFGVKLSNEEEEEEEKYNEQEIPKLRLFEKPLTPSDVGKLNRLVIPKQHAENYFPLNSCHSGGKGLLLSFEDELGKYWRKKGLDAGDIVLFQRHRLDCGRLFIGWRRRNIIAAQDFYVAQPASVASGGGDEWRRDLYSGYPYPLHSQGSYLPYQPDCLRAGSVLQSPSTPNGNSKRLRLFGVNVECHADESGQPSTLDGSPMSSQKGQAHHQYYSN